MQEVLLTVSVIRSARTVGGGAGSVVIGAPQRSQRGDGRAHDTAPPRCRRS